MTTTVYAVKLQGGWKWRATLNLQLDAAYWQRRLGEDLNLLWTGAELSWSQAVRLRDRLTETGLTPPDEDEDGRSAAQRDEWVRRELMDRAIRAGVPEAIARKMEFQSQAGLTRLAGIGKQPFLEQVEMLDSPDVRRLAAAIRGRSLFRDELLSLCAAQGIDTAKERWISLVQAAELQGWLQIRCGVEEEAPQRKQVRRLRRFAAEWKRLLRQESRPRLRCRRCGAGPESLRMAPCPRCGGECAYCERCLGMGRSRMCEPLLEGTPLPSPLAGEAAAAADEHAERAEGAGRADGRGEPLSPAGLREAWGLSPAQAEASWAALQFLQETPRGNGAPDEFLIWAVTGAGKTEMIFPLLAHERKEGRRVLVATPRKDVVLELLPRLRKAFPAERVIALYGGSEHRWEAADITLATTHQLLRYSGAFDLVIIDEIDAFPYAGDPMLHYAAGRAMAPGGRRLFLSATPPRELERQAERGRLPHAKVPARYHGHPLPVPWLVRVKPLAKWTGSGNGARGRRGANGRIPRPLKRLLDRSLERGALLFLFVPEIRLVEPLVSLLRRGYPGRIVEGTSSVDPERVDKVSGFRQRAIDILVTTTILERGVTVPRSDVFVLDAHATWFDEAALVQMAGRAGRSKEDPAGHVVFAAASMTRNQTGAVRQIRRMNRIARKKGFLYGALEAKDHKRPEEPDTLGAGVSKQTAKPD